MEEADECDLLPVAIELKDTADMEKVNSDAIERADVSVTQINMMNAETQKLTDEENDVILEATDRITKKKTEILEAYYTQYNASFVRECGIPDNRIGFVSRLLPYIGYVLLTPAEIVEISRNIKVIAMYYVSDGQQGMSPAVETYSNTDYPTLDETAKIIDADYAVEQGYTGSGIRVGVITDGRPDLSLLSSYTNSITLTQRAANDTLDPFSTITCEIIKRMAPGCNVYVSSVGPAYEALFECESLIADFGVHVINISTVEQGVGYYSEYSRMIDAYVRKYNVPITVAAGDDWSGTGYVNQLALGKDVIAVGAVLTQGTNPDADGAFSWWNGNAYREYSYVINKPDVCAPGVLNHYNRSYASTRVATAFATGTIVQMLSRNSGMIGKPETLKAALIASAYRNAGTDMDYVHGTKSSNQEGAGIIDAEFCYWVARNGRRAHFDTQTDKYLYTHDVWVDTATLPFRVACTWQIKDESLINPSNYQNYDIDLIIYKDGVRVTDSGAFSTHATYKVCNYEVIELSPEILQTYGVGYYHVEIWLLNYVQAGPGMRIGMAWEQPWIDN